MKLLKNCARRRIGIPVRPAILLDPGDSVPVSDATIEDVMKNRTCANWLERGTLVITESDGKEIQPPAPKPKTGTGVRSADQMDQRKKTVLPEGVEEKGVFLHHKGSGWYEVWVNGFKVTDKNLRKDAAEELAEDYLEKDDG